MSFTRVKNRIALIYPFSSTGKGGATSRPEATGSQNTVPSQPDSAWPRHTRHPLPLCLPLSPLSLAAPLQAHPRYAAARCAKSSNAVPALQGPCPFSIASTNQSISRPSSPSRRSSLSRPDPPRSGRDGRRRSLRRSERHVHTVGKDVDDSFVISLFQRGALDGSSRACPMASAPVLRRIKRRRDQGRAVAGAFAHLRAYLITDSHRLVPERPSAVPTKPKCRGSTSRVTSRR
jgi:hypothetical protein